MTSGAHYPRATGVSNKNEHNLQQLLKHDHGIYPTGQETDSQTDRQAHRQTGSPTSVAVVEVGKLVPLVVLDEAQQGALDVRSHLQDELLGSVQGEAGCDEGHVQCPAERGDGVHTLLIVEAEDGVHAPGELGADWTEDREPIRPRGTY